VIRRHTAIPPAHALRHTYLHLLTKPRVRFSLGSIPISLGFRLDFAICWSKEHAQDRFVSLEFFSPWMAIEVDGISSCDESSCLWIYMSFLKI